MATERSNALTSAIGKRTNKVDFAFAHTLRKDWAVF